MLFWTNIYYVSTKLNLEKLKPIKKLNSTPIGNDQYIKNNLNISSIIT
jgi:hypothetical protein